MTEIDIKLTRLIGSKDLSFGCYVFNEYKRIVKRIHTNEFLLTDGARYEINEWDDCVIGHPATPSDLFGWMDSKKILWSLVSGELRIFEKEITGRCVDVKFAVKPFLHQQSEETKEEIFDFIRSKLNTLIPTITP